MGDVADDKSWKQSDRKLETVLAGPGLVQLVPECLKVRRDESGTSGSSSTIRIR